MVDKLLYSCNYNVSVFILLGIYFVSLEVCSILISLFVCGIGGLRFTVLIGNGTLCPEIQSYKQSRNNQGNYYSYNRLSVFRGLSSVFFLFFTFLCSFLCRLGISCFSIRIGCKYSSCCIVVKYRVLVLFINISYGFYFPCFAFSADIFFVFSHYLFLLRTHITMATIMITIGITAIQTNDHALIWSVVIPREGFSRSLPSIVMPSSALSVSLLNIFII